MGNIISLDEVKKYLIRIKQSITKGNYRFEGRRKNLRSLGKIGILPSHVKEVVLQLTCLDYFNGPEEEQNTAFPPGEYMFFGCQVESYEFFVKLKIEKVEDDDYCVCIAFHIAERKIFYAFK